MGALGPITLPSGYYIYTGRAARGLRQRIKRHLGKDKKKHWHIDYLLEIGDILEVFYYPGRFDECKINMDTLNTTENALVIKKFGSSDCRCPGHLVWTGKVRPS